MVYAKLAGKTYPLMSYKGIHFDTNINTFPYVSLGYLGFDLGEKLRIDFYDLKVSLPKNITETTIFSYMRKNLPYSEVDTNDNHYEFESLELKLTRLSNTQVMIEGDAIIFEEYDEDPHLPFSFIVLVDL